MLLILAIAFGTAGISQNNQKKIPVDYVDPLMGTTFARWMLFRVLPCHLEWLNYRPTINERDGKRGMNIRSIISQGFRISIHGLWADCLLCRQQVP